MKKNLKILVSSDNNFSTQMTVSTENHLIQTSF